MISTSVKRCSRCGTDKPHADFPVSRQTKDGRFPYCLPCRRDYRREDHRRSPRSVTEKRYYDIARKYGITGQQFAELLETQGGSCAVCSTPLGEGRERHVDHCHDTGKVRGILCRGCNLGIGWLGDDPDRAIAAAAYLREHRP